MKKLKKVKERVLMVRVSEELLKQLDFFSDKRKSTKSEMVRMAVESYVDDMEKDSLTAAKEDYIDGDIEPEEFVKIMRFKKIPSDLQELRKKKLEQMLTKKRDD